MNTPLTTAEKLAKSELGTLGSFPTESRIISQIAIANMGKLGTFPNEITPEA